MATAGVLDRSDDGSEGVKRSNSDGRRRTSSSSLRRVAPRRRQSSSIVVLLATMFLAAALGRSRPPSSASAAAAAKGRWNRIASAAAGRGGAFRGGGGVAPSTADAAFVVAGIPSLISRSMSPPVAFDVRPPGPLRRTFRASVAIARSLPSASTSAATTTDVAPPETSTERRRRSTSQSPSVGGGRPTPPDRPFKLVVVESPTKCRTIGSILSDLADRRSLPYSFLVDSCYGHVRDLPTSAKDARAASSRTTEVLGVDVANGYEPIYVTLERRSDDVNRLVGLATDENCQGVILATDEDREGEAIAWHLTELLPTDVASERVTFNEITADAIASAFFSGGDDGGDAAEEEEASTEPRGVDMDLVEAQETRRILDRLAGYTVSPLLWKKIAPGLSAGRVQSAGMKLVVDRERERMRFRSSEYWDAVATLSSSEDEKGDGATMEATLVKVNGTRVATGKDFDGETGNLIDDVEGSDPAAAAVRHLTKDGAEEFLTAMAGGEASSWLRDPNLSNWTITSIESKSRSVSPPEPFITSTLQQESNKRLGLTASDAMRHAQALYEGGYISYMRTDSSHLSRDAVDAVRAVVREGHGDEYLADEDELSKRRSKKKKKGKAVDKTAQEAHEAIRPSIQEGGRVIPPDELVEHDRRKGSESSNLSGVAAKLYGLIYDRAAASLMKNQELNQTSVIVEGVSPDGSTVATFRASGSVVVFRGHAAAWRSGGGGGGTDGDAPSSSTLPSGLSVGQSLNCASLVSVEHRTQPPARYTEASFVRELERRGVGRPSTYANVVQTLRRRAYVGTPARPDETPRARKGKQPKGTVISAQRAAGGDEFMGTGRGPLVPSLSAFVVCSLLEKHCPSYVDPSFTATMEDRLDKIAAGDEESSRFAYLEEYYGGEEGLRARVNKIDAEISPDEARRANLPSLFIDDDGAEAKESDEIGLFIGPWGPYIQRTKGGRGTPGEGSLDGDGDKPTTAPLPSGMAADIRTITPGALSAILESRESDGIVLGQHPEDGRNVRLKFGRFGAYLQWGDYGEEGTTTHSLPKHIGGMRNANFQGDGSIRDGDGENLGAILGMISIEEAVGYTSLPRTVCSIQDLPVTAAIGPYGPYLKFNNSFVSLNKDDGDVLSVDAETAERVVTEGIINKTSTLGRGVLAELGVKDGSTVCVKDGRYGVYINWKRVNAKMPPEYLDRPDEVPLEDAWSLIQEKAGSASAGKSQKARQESSVSVTLPPPPKRPLSAYLHYCAEKRPQVMESVDGLGKISKELARLWAETEEDDSGENLGRKRYEELAAAGKIEYEARKRAWKEECDKILAESENLRAGARNGARNPRKKPLPKNALVRKKTPKTRRKAAVPKGRPRAPKRPLSAYLYFCKENRPAVSEKVTSLGDISKELARLWAETAEDEGARQPYMELAAADKARYEQEMMAYKGISGNANNTQPRDKKKSSAASKSGKASPRPPSAYMLFCSANRQHVVGEDGNKLSFGDTARRLAEMWRECNSETRSSFEAKAAIERQKILS